MAKVNKKFEELTKEMDEVFLDKEAYYEELSYEMGENEGRKEEKIEIAKNLLIMGLIDKGIVIATGLTLEEIESLKK